jgi:threonine/homoserine/homoserine lactone efflux protein
LIGGGMACCGAAFEIMRWLGVAWLVWLGIQAFRAGPSRFDGKGGASGFRAWRQGTLVNLLNPKTIIFILAFLPQFVDPARGSSAVQMLALGMIFVVTSTACRIPPFPAGGEEGEHFVFRLIIHTIGVI